MTHLDIHRVVFSAAALFVLSACATVSHFESERRLDADYKNLVTAKNVAVNQARPSPVSLDTARSPGPEFVTVRDARIALALDAQHDVDQSRKTGSTITEYDRISLLYRATIKAWHAGNVWENPEAVESLRSDTWSTIQRDGESRCASLKEAAPDRDCGIIRVGRLITLMEIAASNIFDAGIARKRDTPGTDARLTVLTKSVLAIDVAMDRLDRSATPPELAEFLNVQRVHYFCSANAAIGEIVNIGPHRTPLQRLGREAAKWVQTGDRTVTLSPALRDAFERNNFSNPADARGAYLRIADRTKPLVAGSWDPREYGIAKRRCIDWANKTPRS